MDRSIEMKRRSGVAALERKRKSDPVWEGGISDGEMEMQKRIKEEVKKRKKLIEQIKERRRLKMMMNSDSEEDDVVTDTCLMITSNKNPELMAKVMLDNVTSNTPLMLSRRLPEYIPPPHLSPHHPNVSRIANIALLNFNQQHDSSYVLERVVSGSGYFDDCTLTFLASHPYQSINITSLFYAHYYLQDDDNDDNQLSPFKELTLLRPFIDSPLQVGGGGGGGGGPNHADGDAKQAAQAQSTPPLL